MIVGRHGLLLRAELRAQWRVYEDTLRRLARGRFDDLSPLERAQRADAVVSLAAQAAVALGAAPIPFLELPVHVAMVEALGRIYGVPAGGRKTLLRIVFSLGGGLALRQLLRFIPVGGQLSLLSRIYGATYALGRAAQLHFEQQGDASQAQMRDTFEQTLDEQQLMIRQRMRDTQFVDRLERLRDRWRDGGLSDEDYRAERDRLLQSL